MRWRKLTALFVVDEVRHLSYDYRAADLRIGVLNRHETGRPIVITTNNPSSAWSEMLPNAAGVVVLVDRLVHRREIVSIEGDSHRLREANERAGERR